MELMTKAPPARPYCAGATLVSVDDVPGGVQLAMDVVVEIKDAEKPACVAQTLSRLYF